MSEFDTEDNTVQESHAEMSPIISNQEIPDTVEIESEGHEPEEEVQQEADGFGESQEEAPVRRKRVSGKARIAQIQREKFQAMEEAQRLAEDRVRLIEENDQLRRLNEHALDTAFVQSENVAIERLERARELKAQAIESGDVKAQVDADVALSAAVQEYSKVSSEKNQRIMKEQYYGEQAAIDQQKAQYAAEQQAQQQYSDPYTINRDVAESWVSDNDWFLKSSPNYDPQLSTAVNILCDQIDAQLYREGNHHMIMSNDYFNYVNNAVNTWRQNSNQRSPTMRSTSPVAPVRQGGHAQGFQQTRREALNTDERELLGHMKSIGVSPEMYVQQRIKDKQQRPDRYRSMR